jgi:hypothetical protein
MSAAHTSQPKSAKSTLTPGLESCPTAAKKDRARKEWMPRMWLGFSAEAWVRLLIRNRCAVELPYYYVLVIVSIISVINSVLRVLQDVWFGSRVRKTPIRHAPVFIVGHWRSGTTLLHELLNLDPRHNFPNTYQCGAPHHFLLTEKWMTRLLWWLMPARRPMDGMENGWDKPQEDEFALCMVGQPSPYLTLGFPNRPPQDEGAYDLEGMSSRALRRWKRAFLLFLRQLTFRDPRRLVLKSPTHSCRIPTLLELFPDARFILIVRDPYAVFPSTVNLWKTLYTTHGLQTPRFAGLEEYVFSTFTHFHERLEEGKRLIPAGQFHALRYEDLLRDPLGEMRRLYERLDLGDFEGVRARVEQYFAARAKYRTNHYGLLSPQLRTQIEKRWGAIIQQYGSHRRE